MIDTVLQAWFRHKWWLIGALLLALGTSTSLILALPDIYRGTTTVLVGQDDITGSLVSSGNISQLDQRLHVIRQELLSREQLMLLINRYDLYPELRNTVPAEALLARMRKDVLISQSTTSQISLQRGQPAPMEVRISYQGWSAVQVADVANALAAIYREKFEGIRVGQALRTTEFLQDQLDEVEQRLHAREREINVYRAENLGHLPEQVSLNLSTLERFNADLRINAERQMQLLLRAGEIRSTAFGGVVSVTGEPRLNTLLRELSVMRARFNDSHPAMIRLQEEIRILQDAQKASVQPVSAQNGGRNSSPEANAGGEGSMQNDDLQRLRVEEAAIRSSISSILTRLQLTPEIDQTLTQMTHAYNSVREEHLLLHRRFQDARLAQSLETQQTQQFQVLEMALPPGFSSGPDRIRLLIIAVILTLGALGATLYIAEQMDHTFHSNKELSQFSTVPVLTMVSHMDTGGERIGRAATTLTIALAFAVVVILLSGFAYSAGQTARGIVWLVVGANA